MSVCVCVFSLQGFTRPKVLLLLPQRNLAFKCVLRLVRLAMRETRADSVTGKERFVEQFTDPEVGYTHTHTHTHVLQVLGVQKCACMSMCMCVCVRACVCVSTQEVPEADLDPGTRARRKAKPADYRALIGTGNTDDHFRLGVKITRGAIR